MQEGVQTDFFSLIWPTDTVSEEILDKEDLALRDVGLLKLFNRLFEPDIMPPDIFKCYFMPCRDRDLIKYRQDIFRDLENRDLFNALNQFSSTFRRISRIYSDLGNLYPTNRDLWKLDIINEYCSAVLTLYEQMEKVEAASEGIISLGKFLQAYVSGREFMEMCEEGKRVQSVISGISYELVLFNDRVKIRRSGDGEDYSREVMATFSNIAGDLDLDRKPQADPPGTDHVQSAILSQISKLFPDEFRKLSDFSSRHNRFIDKNIVNIHRDLQFYISYIKVVRPLSDKGLNLCYPEISDQGEIRLMGFYDMVLALQNTSGKVKVITNDLCLSPSERRIIVTGPNSGGKTTYARSIGQMSYLLSIGVPVPGKEVVIPLFDRIFTHFEGEEDLDMVMGKLEDDLHRIKNILELASERSLIIMNETLSSTTVSDAIHIASEILKSITEKGSMFLFVTFLEELAQYSGVTSITNDVDMLNPEKRTYIFKKGPPTYSNFLLAISRKYGLTKEQIIKRLKE